MLTHLVTYIFIVCCIEYSCKINIFLSHKEIEGGSQKVMRCYIIEEMSLIMDGPIRKIHVVVTL